MGYVLKQKDIPNGVRIFINADSNDWDLISTLNTYDLDRLEDDGAPERNDSESRRGGRWVRCWHCQHNADRASWHHQLL